MGGICGKRTKHNAAHLNRMKEEAEMVEHKIELSELQAMLQTDYERGLTIEEAQVRLAKNGKNMLTPPFEKSDLIKFLECMSSGFQIMLWVGGVLCCITYGVQASQFSGTGSVPRDNLWLGIVLWLVTIVIGTFSFYQQGKSSKIMAAFKKMVPKKALVTRSGEKITIDASEIVIGDIVVVRAGDQVPADIRILQSSQFKVDNSSLTGESEPQTRNNQFTNDNPLETGNLAFFSVYCVEGECTGVVIRTGDMTVMGRIACLASGLTSDMTPIAKEIHRFIRMITIIAVCFGLVFFIISLAMGYIWLDAVIFLISIIVANVPEGLLCTLTISLTLAAKRMAQKNCLVKNLEAVETLGSTSTICSDKTGTLTQSRMTVMHLWYNKEFHESDLSVDQSNGCYDMNEEGWQALVKCSMLCSRSEFKSGQERRAILDRECTGDASESALLRFAELTVGNVVRARKLQSKVAEIPFNSVNKFQVSVHNAEEGADYTYVVTMKGAPERIIDRCATMVLKKEDVPITEDFKQSFEEANDDLGRLGERVLGFADLRLSQDKFPKGFVFDSENINFPYQGLRFLGLIALMDPPRPNVSMAVEKCRRAGIRVVMVTGDQPSTAKAIAQMIGIIQRGSETPEDVAKKDGIPLHMVDLSQCKAKVVTGSLLKDMTPEELDKIIATHPDLVFARTSPQQKLIIVEGFQRQGLIVAVTGDGVNDSPALKQADIGIAMGIAGSDVSKQAAGMILLDDNFASIVTGVEEGRRIFDNLKKSICYTLASNIPELVPFLAYIVFSIPLPIGSIAILCIDIVTDMLPSISFAYEDAEHDIMQRKPRNPIRDRLVSLKLLRMGYAIVGLIESVGAFFGYLFILNAYGFPPGHLMFLREDWEAKYVVLADQFGQEWNFAQRRGLEYTLHTDFFISIVLMQWADLVVSKTSRHSILHQGMNSNWLGVFSLYFMSACALFLSYCPGLDYAIHLYPLYFYWWFLPLPYGFLLIVYDEIRKYFIRKYPGGYIDVISCY